MLEKKGQPAIFVKTPVWAPQGPKVGHLPQKWTFSLITQKIPELQRRFNELIFRFRHAGSIYAIFKVIDLDLDPEIAISLLNHGFLQ